MLIVITGYSASGKTYLLEKLKSEFNIPCLAKDDIKELLFDQLGTGDKKWAQKLGATAYKIMFSFAKKLYKTSGNLIIESNFVPGLDEKNILEIEPNHKNILQILCYADKNTISERSKARYTSKHRHKGHKYEGQLGGILEKMDKTKPEDYFLNLNSRLVKFNSRKDKISEIIETIKNL